MNKCAIQTGYYLKSRSTQIIERQHAERLFYMQIKALIYFSGKAFYKKFTS